MKKLLVVYLILSILASAVYMIFPGDAAFEIATHRCGLLIVSVEDAGVYMLNPLNLYCDDWIVLARW